MAYADKKTIETIYQLIEEGWEPEFHEIKNKFYPSGKGRTKLSEFDREKLTRHLVSRIRRKFKKDGSYFYCVNGHFKLLESSKDRLSITDRLWNSTRGYIKSTHSLLEDTMNIYPKLTQAFIMRFRARLDTIKDLALMVAEDVEAEVKKNEDSNK